MSVATTLAISSASRGHVSGEGGGGIGGLFVALVIWAIVALVLCAIFSSGSDKDKK